MFTQDPVDAAGREISYMEATLKNGKQFITFKNPLPINVYAVVQSTAMSENYMKFNDNLGQRSQFLIKAYHSEEPLNDMQRIKPIDSNIDFVFSDTAYQVLNLEWKPILDYSVTPPVALVAEYTIFYTAERNANLASACVMNKDVAMGNNLT